MKSILALILIALITTFSGCTTIQQTPTTTAWEYKLLDQEVSHSPGKQRFEDALNSLADEGWIVSSSSTVSTDEGVREDRMFVILKRPKDP